MSYLVLIMSLIQPIYALPFAAYRMIKSNSYIYIFCIALAFSTIAINLVPSPQLDLFRHYQHIESIDRIPLSSIVQNYEPGYLLFDVYSWLLLKLGLPKETLLATAVFIAYGLVLSIFQDVKKKYLQESSILIIFLVLLTFLIQVSPIGISSGIRNTLANIVVFYSTYKLVNDKSIFIFILYSILALLIHPAAFIPIVIVLLGYYLNNAIYKYSKFIILISIVLMLFSSYLRPIIDYLDSLASILPFYSSGTYTDLNSHWGAGFEKYASTNGIIADLISKLPTYFSLFYLLFITPRKDNSLYTILCLGILYLSIFSSYATLFGRVNNFHLNIFTSFIVTQMTINKSKFHIYSLLMFLFLCLLGYITQLYSFSDFWLTSIKSFYKPLPFYMTGI